MESLSDLGAAVKKEIHMDLCPFDRSSQDLKWEINDFTFSTIMICIARPLRGQGLANGKGIGHIPSF
jgi:hypothetical protein